MTQDQNPPEETPEGTPAEGSEPTAPETPAPDAPDAPEATPPEAPEQEQPAPEPEAPAEPAAAPVPGGGESPPPEAASEPPAPAAEPETAEPPAPESDDEPTTPRVKPAIPGADLEVDIVPEGSDPLARAEAAEEAEAAAAEAAAEAEQAAPQAVIDLAAGARYTATGKRKTAVARVILRPGSGSYLVNGKHLDDHFPRPTLQRTIRGPLETVGLDSKMDVLAKLHGGGISAQAGALRHGIARALIEADPNLRAELKRRGFLTRDSRAKERKKAGLKKARKRPQFSKR